MKAQSLFYCTLFALTSQQMAAMNIQDSIKQYIDNSNSIPGWFETKFVDPLLAINTYQNSHSIQGNIAEIGVFYGKSFIPLYLMAGPNDFLLAIDCFENQQFNYDKSGPGARYANFLNTLKKFIPDTSMLRVISGDSSTKTAQDYLNACNGKKFRMFSIDGCHRAKETGIDLKNAAESLVPGGIIIIDDYFNKEWPGVSEGVSQFLVNNPTIKPFFIGHNKMLLTNAEYVLVYYKLLKAHFKPMKESEFHNSLVLIY